MKKILVFIAFAIFATNVIAGENDLFMIVKGDKDQVMSLVHKAMQVEFSSGVVGNYDGRVGYKVYYNSFATGQTSFGIGLAPVSDGDNLMVTAYKLEIGYQTQKGSQFYITQIAKNLKAEIAKQASVMENVSVINDAEGYKYIGEQADKCIGKLQSDPELSGISKKLSLSNASTATLAMLADDAKPTEAEKALISLWSSKRDTCFQAKVFMSTFYPSNEQWTVFLQSYNASNQLIVNLYKSAISYGEFTKQRQELNLDNQKRAQQINAKQTAQQQNNAENERQHQLEQQRVNIEQQKANAIQTQANKIQIPTIVNQTTNCTSRVVGNSVQTTCN